MKLILLCVCCSLLKAAGEKHTLQYLYVLRSAPEEDLEFEITTVLDGLIISHCKSPTFRDQARHDWIHQGLTVEEWKSRDTFCESDYYFHKTLKENIEQMTNKTGGIIQRERSCTAEDSTVYMSDRWGLNGEDFLTLDPNTLKWSSDSSLASSVQSEWNQIKMMDQTLKHFQHNQCKPFLMKLKKLKDNYLKENLRPDVFIFAKPSNEMDPVFLQCFVSHKYLPGIRVRLMLDGMVVDNVHISSPAPNMDGTVQIRLQTETSIKEPGRFHCAVDTNDLHIAAEWDGKMLDKKHLVEETTLHSFTKQQIIITSVCSIAAVAIICLVAFNVYLIRQARRQNTLSNGANFIKYVQEEKQWRIEAEADDEFYWPQGRPYRNFQVLIRPSLHSL